MSPSKTPMPPIFYYSYRNTSSISRLIATIVLVLLPINALALEKVTLQLKWLHQFQFAGYYAALEKGYYKEAGLDVSILERDGAHTPLDRVLSGQVNYGVSDSSLILHRLNGSPVVVLGAIFQHSPLVLMTRKEDNLISPYDLKGKRVMHQRNVDDASLTAMFHALDIKDGDVIHVPHTFNEEDFFSGKVDAMSAYSSNQPYIAKQRGIAVQLISPINYGVDFYGDMLFVSEQEIKENPDRTVKFLEASIKGWRYAIDNTEEIIQLIIKQYSSRKSADHLRFEAGIIKNIIRANLVQIGHLNTERFKRLADIYKNEGLVEEDATLDGIDYRKYITPSNKLHSWLFWLAVVAAAILIALGVLMIINRRLTQIVAARTSALLSNQKKLEHYVSVVDQYVLTSAMNERGIITDISDAFCAVTEYSRDELIGQPHHIIQQFDGSDKENDVIWQCISSGEAWHGEIEGKTKTGKAIWLETNIQPNVDKEKNISGYTSIIVDITDKKRIEQLSITDKLTGLYNRVKLDSALAFELYRANRTLQGVSIIIIDIDFFKRINDSYGHITGDKILIHVGNIIKRSVRSLDIVGRWGGEEFFIISPSTHLDGAYALASKIRRNIEKNPLNDIHVTASLGIASFNLGEQAEEFVKRADNALYSAKHKGRNRVESNQERKVHYLSERS